MLTHPIHGYYSVNNVPFRSKIAAYRESLLTGHDVKWHYFTDIFKSIDKNSLGQASLDELYKHRAQQLRDSYDYLVLYYSGGSDSWQVLNTFLKNNIKLDCIFVHHPTQLHAKTYTPNILDTTSRNNASEWDFIIKKDLEWLAVAHPNINIEVGDWSTKISNVRDDMDSIFDSVITSHTMVRLLKKVNYCEFETKMVSQGKTVGCIYGVDKPIIVEKNDRCYITFADRVLGVGEPNPINPTGTEYFYCSPKFPRLTLEQGFQLYKWYVNSPPNIRAYIASRNIAPIGQPMQLIGVSDEDFIRETRNKEKIAKMVLYPEWNANKFQSEKPVTISTSKPDVIEWDDHLSILPEFKELTTVWYHHWDSLFGDKLNVRKTIPWSTAEWIYLTSADKVIV